MCEMRRASTFLRRTRLKICLRALSLRISSRLALVVVVVLEPLIHRPGSESLPSRKPHQLDARPSDVVISSFAFLQAHCRGFADVITSRTSPNGAYWRELLCDTPKSEGFLERGPSNEE